MLIGLNIRDVVLIDSLDLVPGVGLTALTGETGAGKSIVLDALGLTAGARADAGLVRRGTSQAVATAIFSLPAGHPAFDFLDEKGLGVEAGEALVLRRQISVDGRSRAYVNDQAASVGVLRELGALLIEVHGQHDAVGLLDARTHRALLDTYGGCIDAVRACRTAWTAWRDALAFAQALRARVTKDAADADELSLRLAELDRLDPQAGEETALAEQRAILGSAEKIMADISAAQDAFSAGQLANRLAQSARHLERARERVQSAATSAEAAPSAPSADEDEDSAAVRLLIEAVAAVERTLIEADEARTALDAASSAFVFEPARLEQTEERLFALRAAARKLGVAVEALPAQRIRFAEALRTLESADAELAAAETRADQAGADYRKAAAALTLARTAAAKRLAVGVEAELKPLKLEKARFQVAVEPLSEDRAGPEGMDRVAFEISTNPGAPFGPLGDIASGGELARLALALKVSLANRRGEGGEGAGFGPVMIFDEVDQGVGGAVADAVGLRLKRLAETGQVLVVTHSPQVAARADTHWRVSKKARADHTATAIETLTPAAREEELARMLAGAQVTEAARAAARALMEA
jgi:DNA repair protein RecN (Recombination protein N)